MDKETPNERELIRKSLPIPSNVPYLVAVVSMAIITVSSLVIIAVSRPVEDNSSLYVMIIGFSTTTTAAILAFMKSQETHLSVNSRLEQFIRNADRAARAEGNIAGRAAADKDKDKDKDI